MLNKNPRNLKLIYENQPPLACIYTHSYVFIRESYAFIRESLA